MEQINIVLASDSKYYPGLLVTAVSIAAYATKGVSLVYYILDGGLHAFQKEELVAKVRNYHTDSRIEYLYLDESKFKEYGSYHDSLVPYMRLLLPDLLPKVEQIIYCDVDFLWMADIAELWELRDDNIILSGVKDPLADKGLIEGLRENGWNVKYEEYICSGLLIMNLKLMREQKIVPKLLSFLDSCKNNTLPDQNALNCVLVRKIRLLNKKWMYFNTELRDPLNPVVVHYATYGGVLFGVKRPHPLFIADDSVVLWNRVYRLVSGKRIYGYYWNRVLFRLALILSFWGFKVGPLSKERARFKQPKLMMFK